MSPQTRRVASTMSGRAAVTYPLDSLSNIQAAYSMRRLLKSYTGNLVRLRRDSDDDESDFGYDANGDLDVVAISTWLGGATGYVRTLYDQSGNGYDAEQSTDALQFAYAASAMNSKPGCFN